MAKLAAVQAEMARLVEKLDAAIAEEKRLTTEYETAKKRFNRAIELIDKLKNEEVSWKEALIKNRANKVNLTGDVIISAGVIAYLGVFTVEYRMEAIKSWLKLCKDLEIKASEDFRIKDVLGVGTTI
jgi:dynein heavy chain